MPAKAYSTKNLKIWLSGQSNRNITPTAITKAEPAVVTGVGLTLGNGDVAYVTNTGFPEIDGKYFTVGSNTATNFTLNGSKTTDSDGVLVATPLIEVYEKPNAVDLGCVSKGITFSTDPPASIAAGTYCQPSLAIVSPVTPPSSIEITGNINITDDAYYNLVGAVDDAAGRVISVVLPSNGEIVAPVIASAITWDLPVDGVQGFTATFTCGTTPKHRFNPPPPPPVIP